MRFFSGGWRLLVASLFIAGAEGTTLYTTGGPPLIFFTGAGDEWQIGGLSTTAEFLAVADPFSPSTSGVVGSIDLALSAISGTGLVTVSIETGATPTTVVESLTVAAPAVASVVSVSSVLHPGLTAGNNYWLVVGTTGNLVVDWWVNIFPRNTDFEFPSGGGWNNSTGASWGAFDLQSTAPEVSSGVLSALGMLLLVCWRGTMCLKAYAARRPVSPADR
jgi:hypothetical protein